MESWKNGREEIFELLTRICNQTGEKIKAEINDTNDVRIDREELRSLQDGAAATSKLRERYGRLQDELDETRARASRVEELERENKRLAGELRQKLQPLDVTTPGLRIIETKSRATPASNGPPSSFSKRIEVGGIKYVPWEDYQSQIKKYNDISQSYLDAKDAKEQVERALREERDKAKQWASNDAEMKTALEKKKYKIQRLMAEMKSFKKMFSDNTTALDNADSETCRLAPRDSEDALRDPYGEVPRNSSESRPSSNHPPMSRGASADNAEVDLLRLPHNHDLDVEDTEFELVEQHQSETTEAGSDPILDDQRTPINIQSINHQKATNNQNLSQGSMDRSLSPSTPTVISSRSVKKRKFRHEVAAHSPVTKVKTEEIGSSPVGLAGLHNLDPNESIDLDDIGEKVDTPRKHRQLEQIGGSNRPQLHCSRSQTQSQNYYRTSQTSPLGDNTPVNYSGMMLQPRSANYPILSKFPEDKASKRRRFTSDLAVADLYQHGVITKFEERQSAAELIWKSKPRKAGETRSNLLLTTSKPVLERGTNRDTRLGTLLEQPSPRKQVFSPSSDARGSTNQASLDRALATSSFTREFEYTPSQPISRGSVRGLEYHAWATFRETQESPAHSKKPPSKILSRTEPMRVTPTISRRNTILASPTSTTPHAPAPINAEDSRKRLSVADDTLVFDISGEPLRVRPFERLNIYDFKINPDYNQGYNYAFNEVVRGGSARACLSGCTKPDCCGKGFRALAEITRNTGKPLTVSQEEVDVVLLNDFMGDNAYKIRNMTNAEKEEMTIQAKTRELANKHGRHRMAYERRASPPGFWRADFPTTQEDLADKERSRAKERDVVAERYQQAMRPGGAYVFRDE